MIGGKLVNESQGQRLLDSFKQPIVLIDSLGRIVASNKAMKGAASLINNPTKIVELARPLIEETQEVVHGQIDGRDYLLSAVPMQRGYSLIKIADSKPSALARRYSNLVAVIDQVPDAVIVITDGVVELVNEKFEETFTPGHDFYGKSVSQLLTHVLPEVIDGIARGAAIKRLLLRKLKTQQQCKFSFQLTNHDYFEYRDTITPNGGRVGLLINESQIHELNTQLESAFNEASALSRAKGSFLAAMTHEVRTPLASIIGLLDLCRNDHDLRGNPLLKRINFSAHKLLRLLNDVLDFSKFDANKVELTPTNIDIRHFCEELIARHYGLAKKKNTKICLYVSPELPRFILADELRLTQVLSNLINNGTKFNCDLNPTVKLSVDLHPLTTYVRFRVIDNGIGISKANQSKIFVQFEQATPNIQSQYGGAGLGLSICQKIVQLMDGDISIDSEEGKGATFCIELPLLTSGDSLLSKFPQPYFSSLTVVSDDPDFLEIAAQYSQDFGFQTRLLNATVEDKSTCFYFLSSTLAYNEYSHRLKDSVVVRLAKILSAQCGSLSLQYPPLELEKFLVILNQTEYDASALHLQTQQETENFQGVRILIVEDDDETLYVLKKQMQMLSVSAVFAMTPEDAILFFEQQQFNMVISDYYMPQITGDILTGYLREIEEEQNRTACNIIVQTADNTPDKKALCIQAGADAVIEKPLTLEKLVQLFTPLREAIKANSITVAPNADSDETNELILPEAETSDTSEISSSGKALNINALFNMVGQLSNEEVLDYLEHYSTNLRAMLTEMYAYYSDENWAALRKKAHNLKSNAKIIGAVYLSAQSEILEDKLMVLPPEENLEAIFNEVTENIDKLLAEIDDFRGT